MLLHSRADRREEQWAEDRSDGAKHHGVGAAGGSAHHEGFVAKEKGDLIIAVDGNALDLRAAVTTQAVARSAAESAASRSMP
jgi:hypothetical protein